ncbi:hypothetical protein DC522_33040, partial [Microvirga sp. KLBC 81]|uniref:hypothetical protein n=1 Tax=Microvirga sp. KLBC 81 TaxID=1862707 RepID=UPI000D5173A8
HLALAPGSRGLQSGTTIPWPPSMERVLIEPGRQVNTHSEEFSEFFEVFAGAPGRQTQQTRSQKTAFFWAVLTERAGALRRILGCAPEEPVELTKDFVTKGSWIGPDTKASGEAS